MKTLSKFFSSVVSKLAPNTPPLPGSLTWEAGDFPGCCGARVLRNFAWRSPFSPANYSEEEAAGALGSTTRDLPRLAITVVRDRDNTPPSITSGQGAANYLLPKAGYIPTLDFKNTNTDRWLRLWVYPGLHVYDGEEEEKKEND